MHTHSTEVCPQSSPARTPSGAPVAAWPPTRERRISRARGVPHARPGARPPGPCFGHTTTTPNHCMRKSEPAPDGASQHAVRTGRNALRSKTGGRTARSVRRLVAMRAQRPVGTAVATGLNPCAFLFRMATLPHVHASVARRPRAVPWSSETAAGEERKPWPLQVRPRSLQRCQYTRLRRLPQSASPLLSSGARNGPALHR